MSLSRHYGASRRLPVYAILFTFVWICQASPAHRDSMNQSEGNSSTADFNDSSSIVINSTIEPSNSNAQPENSTTETAFDDLAKVLGMRLVPLHLRNRSPPEYFNHLFKSISDGQGVMKKPAPYHADEVVGYLDQGGTSQQYYFYNVSEVETDSEMLNADLHLYRLGKRTTTRRFKRSNRFIILKIYQVTNLARKHSPFGNRLIDMKRVLTTQNSWVVFRIREAVQSWVSAKGNNNYGVLITAQYADGSPVRQSDTQFAQKGQHHDRLQPCIAMYKKKKDKHETSSVDTEMTRAFENGDPGRYDNIYGGIYHYVPPAIPSNNMTSSTRGLRQKRSVNNDSTSSHANPNRISRTDRSRRSSPEWLNGAQNEGIRFCSVHSMRVSFSSMGWDKWIISPADFDARVCLGRCPFPLGQSYYPTNHAVVQSIWKHTNQNKLIAANVKSPCCVPHTLNALNMLYYDEEYKVVLKSYESMVVTSCGCK